MSLSKSPIIACKEQNSDNSRNFLLSLICSGYSSLKLVEWSKTTSPIDLATMSFLVNLVFLEAYFQILKTIFLFYIYLTIMHLAYHQIIGNTPDLNKPIDKISSD